MTLDEELAAIEHFIGKRSGANMATKGVWMCEHGPRLVAALRLAIEHMEETSRGMFNELKFETEHDRQMGLRFGIESRHDDILRALRGEG